MKKIIFIMMILIVSLTGCVNKKHACNDLCYPKGDIDPRFEELINEVEYPVCKKFTQEEIDVFENTPELSQFSPECDGKYTYCDCILNDGSSFLETMNEMN